jgi:hypothetical protein
MQRQKGIRHESGQEDCGYQQAPHRRLAHVSVRVGADGVVEAQRTLVLVLLEKATKEQRTFTSVNDAVNNYRQILLDLGDSFQDGVDEFKGRWVRCGVQV